MHEVLKDKKFIFFDVGYTLDAPASGHWMFTNKFLEFTKDKLDMFDNATIHSAMLKGFAYIEKNHKLFTIEEEISTLCVFYQIVSDELSLGLTIAQIYEISKDRATNMNNYLLYPKVKETLEVLFKSFKLGIISDTWPSIVNQLTHLGIFQFFTTFTFSYDVGVFKPDEKMFIDALNKCGVAASETVFIDDQIENLEAAEKLGITPILIAANPSSDVQTKYTKIHSIAELLD
jgi:putative hydrolase of the HAD superfamily